MKAACVQSSRVAANCVRCGARPQLVHIQTASLALLCQNCCPVCTGIQEKPE